MARTLKGDRGFAGVEPAAAIPEAVAAEPGPAKSKRYLPYTTTDELPRPVTREKTRLWTLPDGSKEAQKILVYVKSGEPRYSVTEHGELLAHFIKRGGVGRRLAFQFKKQFPDTKEGRDRKATHQSFRNKLKAAGIPGA